MISALLNGDPANFSPTECGLAIQHEANRLVREQGLNLTQAWARVKVLNPEVYARMGGVSPASQAGATAAQAPGTIQTSAALRVTYDVAFKAAMDRDQADLYGAHRAGMNAVNAVPALGAMLGSRPIATGTTNGPKASALGNEGTRRNLAAFTKVVETHAGAKGVSVERAWHQCQSLYPALYAALANDGGACADCPPVDQDFMDALGLPADVSADEAGLAWRANGSTLKPLQAQPILDALAGYHMGRTGLSIAVAKGVVASRFPALVSAADVNAGDASDGAALGNETNGSTLVVIGNEAAIDADGWCLIAPYGEWPKTRVFSEGGQVKTQHYLQVVDNAAADALAGKENSLFLRMKRAVVGIPIFKGHGDLNDVDPKAIGNGGEKIKLGVVDEVRKGANGVEAHFALDGDGAAAVAAGFKFPSGFWYVAPLGNSTGNVIRCRPVKLISVALTDQPNIAGVESLANAG